MADTYTDISTARTDADSPVDEDLALDIADNDRHNFNHAIRSGTFTTGVRTAMARGHKLVSGTTSGGGDLATSGTTTVTFSTDSDDGNPNFTAAPRVYLTVMESATSVTDWGSGNLGAGAWITEGSVSATQFQFTAWMLNGPATSSVEFDVQWIAIGPVTAGE